MSTPSTAATFQDSCIQFFQNFVPNCPRIRQMDPNHRLILKISTFVIGVLLIFLGVHFMPQMGTAGGCTLAVTGSLMLFAWGCLRCITARKHVPQVAI